MAIKVEGTAVLAQRLKALGQAAGGKALRSGTLRASLPLFNAVKASAPVGSVEHRTYKGRLVAPGFLRRNVRRASFLTRDGTKATVAVGFRREAFYAQFLEFGTGVMKAQPFVERSFYASRDPMLNRLRVTLKQAIEKAARGSK